MTDLPYGRGGSPLQNLIVRGHQETVICALKCVAELDAGPVYLRRSLSLQGTAEEILQTASAVIGEMIGEIVRKEPVPIAQVGEPVVFQRRGPEDGNLLQADGLRQVFDYIRMLDAEGYPPAFIQVGALRLEFSEASLGDQVVTARVQITRANIHEK